MLRKKIKVYGEKDFFLFKKSCERRMDWRKVSDVRKKIEKCCGDQDVLLRRDRGCNHRVFDCPVKTAVM